MKKGDDKWAGPYTVTKVYPRACALDLRGELKVFPVFHHSLLRLRKPSAGLRGQDEINQAESRHLRGRVLERNDDTEEVEERWEFEAILDCHNQGQLTYLVKWKYHAPTWQPHTDLKGCDEVVRQYHADNPHKPGPPPWLKRQSPRHTRNRASPLYLQQCCFSQALFGTNRGLGGGYCHGTNPASRACLVT